MKHFYKGIPGWSRFTPIYAQMVREAPTDRPSRFVEVGAWKGRSAAFMGVEIANSGKPIAFFVVDTWEGSDEPVHRADKDVQAGRLEEVFLQNTAPVSRWIQPVTGKSHVIAQTFPQDSLDFVLLDASHDYESVYRDLESWYPRVRPGGVIAGDDYTWKGVRRACDEFFGRDVAYEKQPYCWMVRK